MLEKSAVVSVPLPGLRSWKVPGLLASLLRLASFSPVAGIKVVERNVHMMPPGADENVSVPLPGLRSWKARNCAQYSDQQEVSVPLPGLRSWKAIGLELRL